MSRSPVIRVSPSALLLVLLLGAAVGRPYSVTVVKPRLKDADELLAKAAITAALRVPVHRTDDGSVPAMCDLEIRYATGPPAAVEVVSTRDQRAQQLTSATLGKGHTARPELTRVWGVSVSRTTHVRKMERRLPGFLARLEAAGVTSVSRQRFGPWHDEMKDLGIDLCFAGPPTDKVRPGFRLFPAATGAFVQDIERAVERCEEFLGDLDQRDVTRSSAILAPMNVTP